MALKNQNLAAAWRKIHARGETAATLAVRLHTSRTHVTQVINGTRRKGRSWDRVKDLLRSEEIELLEPLGESRTRDLVPCGTMAEVGA